MTISFLGCEHPTNSTDSTDPADSTLPENYIVMGASQFEIYLPLLQNKTAGLVVNQTSVVGTTHLVDTLNSLNINIGVIFGPEHGFRGTTDDGVTIEDEKDRDSGISIISLYGKKRKPTPEDLEGIEIVVFDIQDVGTRFYTYVSTMHYVMEACVENNVPFIVLDRPNPNGHYVDGPVRKEGYESFVGMHPIPVVHGLTVGELAQMINEEGWLKAGKCDLTIVPLRNYTHKSTYSLPIKPSPNLTDDQAIRMYPSTCFFEGTKISEGRGTLFPFLLIGYPDKRFGSFSFTPESMPGMSTYPRYEGEKCFGVDLRNVTPPNRIDLSYLIEFYKQFSQKESFFNNHFNRLAGTNSLREQIENGYSEEVIRASWQEDLNKYKVMRKKYLLYPDSE